MNMNVNLNRENYFANNQNSNNQIPIMKPLNTARPKLNRHRNSELIFPISNLINNNNIVNSLKLEDVNYFLTFRFFLVKIKGQL